MTFWTMFFTKIFSWSAFVDAFLPIIKMIPSSLEMTIIAMVFGLLLGLILALVRINKIPILNQLRALFVNFIRGTPYLSAIIPFIYRDSVDFKSNQYELWNEF